LRAAFAIAAAASIGALCLLGLGLDRSDAASAATSYKVNVGGGARGIAVEAFMPKSISVHEGDTIEFVNPYEEIHTVTFVAGGSVPELIVPAGPPAAAGPPKLMFNPIVAFPSDEAAAKAFDGSKYANSGIIGKGQAWNVTFAKQGSYKFLCVLHPGMEASVSVVAPNVDATTPAKAEFDASAQLQEWIAAGERSASMVVPGRTANANGTATWQVLNAPSAGQADVMRFIPQRVSVNAGDTVLWRNDTPVPHTITFAGNATPELVIPEPQAGGPPNLVINPQVLFPVKPSNNYSGSGYVNSGFIGAGPEATGGTNFSLTFTTPGSYLYICVLHADQGMAGVVEVLGARPVSPPSTGDGGLVDSERRSRAGLWLLPLLAGMSVLLVARLRLSTRR
jgi:plastocyanin